MTRKDTNNMWQVALDASIGSALVLALMWSALWLASQPDLGERLRGLANP